MSMTENILIGFIIIIVIIDVVYCGFMLSQVSKIKNAIVNSDPITTDKELSLSKTVTVVLMVLTCLAIVMTVGVLIIQNKNLRYELISNTSSMANLFKDVGKK